MSQSYCFVMLLLVNFFVPIFGIFFFHFHKKKRGGGKREGEEEEKEKMEYSTKLNNTAHS